MKQSVIKFGSNRTEKMSERVDENLETNEEVKCSISNGHLTESSRREQGSEAGNNAISKSKCLIGQAGKSALNSSENLSSSSNENLQGSFRDEHHSHWNGANGLANPSHSTGATNRSLADEQRIRMIAEEKSNDEELSSVKKQVRKRRKDRVRSKSNDQRNILCNQEKLGRNFELGTPLKSDENEPRTSFYLSNANRSEQNIKSEIRRQNQATSDRSLSTEQLSLGYTKEQANKSLSSGYASRSISNEHLSTTSLSERLNRSTSAGQLSRSNASVNQGNYDFNSSLENISFEAENKSPAEENDSMEKR